ncbi:MAG: nucleotidyl transferase AbiEii/AbiGii toxin family protein [bacterium]|nr:nucleotidyl transferase AbiEii/AbiGii toxin family protein [bacterium]MDE0287550.1 nucleotidyl transferase AbiEii/AbiGii toxin family protein [bacterium]MDE0437687.1 nucleotidyl transferase AbiEii/AbiGii toxin family protein [bacterium]
MGNGLLKPPTRRELRVLAADTGFHPDRLEKTVRLLALADDIAAHPYLGERLALTGGTALNMFILDAPRLSFDLDYNYIGSADRDTMKAERPVVEDTLASLLPAHGLRVKKRPNLARDHAGGKWDLRYQDAFGGSEGLSVDVGYVRRVTLWPPTQRDSDRIGRWQATAVPVFDIHEIAAGKLSAFYERGYPRDLFDAGLLPDLPGLDPAKLRTAFVVYGGGARTDWRSVGANPPEVEARDLARQLRPALTRTDAQRIRPLSADAYLAELQAKAAPVQRMVLPFTPPEHTFLDMLLDQGRVEPQLLTADERLQQRIAAEPWLQWKAVNVRRHLAARSLSRAPDDYP